MHCFALAELAEHSSLLTKSPFGAKQGKCLNLPFHSNLLVTLPISNKRNHGRNHEVRIRTNLALSQQLQAHQDLFKSKTLELYTENRSSFWCPHILNQCEAALSSLAGCSHSYEAGEGWVNTSPHTFPFKERRRWCRVTQIWFLTSQLFNWVVCPPLPVSQNHILPLGIQAYPNYWAGIPPLGQEDWVTYSGRPVKQNAHRLASFFSLLPSFRN